MKIPTTLAVGLMAIGATGIAAAQTDGPTAQQNETRRTADASVGKLSNEEFAKKAGASGAAEVEMGKLGSQKATDAEVKAYAQRMVTDHTAANKELMAAAKAKGLEVPTSPDMMHKTMMKKFETQAADQDFDHDYMQQMVRDHKMVVDLYMAAANDTSLDPQLQALAKKTLPTLQQHLKDAQSLEAKLAK